MLAVEDIHCSYGTLSVLWGVSISIPKGELVALVGSNGAGKSTLIKVISGLHRPTRGRVVFQGQDITRVSPSRMVGLGICQVPEGRHNFPSMTVQENLEMGAYSRYARVGRKQVSADMEHVFQTFPILGERRKQRVGTLSGGEQQMVAIGRGLMSQPKLLVLDEPSLGLAPLVVEEIFRTIGELHRSGMTILLVEQNAAASLAIADTAYVLENGTVVIQGKGKDLLQNEQVRQAYLGLGTERRDSVA